MTGPRFSADDLDQGERGFINPSSPLRTKIRPNTKAQLHAKGREKKVRKRTRFGRLMHTRYDEATDRVVYLHPTKGWRSRPATELLFAQMVG